jgi:hypothetical protein
MQAADYAAESSCKDWTRCKRSETSSPRGLKIGLTPVIWALGSHQFNTDAYADMDGTTYPGIVSFVPQPPPAPACKQRRDSNSPIGRWGNSPDQDHKVPMSDPRLAVRTRSDNDSPKAAGSFSSVSIWVGSTRSTHYGPFLSNCGRPCLHTAKCCRHMCELGPPGVCIACQHQHSCDRLCTCGLNRQCRRPISAAAAATSKLSTTSALFLSGWSAAPSGRLSLRQRRGPV